MFLAWDKNSVSKPFCNNHTKESTSQGVKHENQSKHKSEERYKKQAKKSFMGFLKLAIIKALKKKQSKRVLTC
ncbi:hypothetical protein AA977_00925 [Helicobacter pylori]|uniref:Uncharacterized protein n=1 Tax=Helicobacter pylori TaxID=210 RepID=A0A1A9HBF3_HELPX|nr:hypothetical protein AA977_00925 [Helicobacter pylori]